MSDANLGRRTEVEISFDGTDITKDIRPYLKSLAYTDNEEGEADDLQLALQDRDGLWLESWLREAVEAAAAGRLAISASILRKNWRSDGKDDALPCGSFELDGVEASGPPAAVTIRATALPFSTAIRQAKKSRAWEAYTLSGIAGEVAGEAGLGCFYEAAADPFYKRVEQLRTSDISFLSKLCQDAGISLKATDSQLVLFDQAAYEAKPPVMTIKRADAAKPLAGLYTKYKLSAGAAGTQYASCRVSYVDPSNGTCVEGTAQAEVWTPSPDSAWRFPPGWPAPERRSFSPKSSCGSTTSWSGPPRSPCREIRFWLRASPWPWRAGAAGVENTSSPRPGTRWAEGAAIPRRYSSGGA